MNTNPIERLVQILQDAITNLGGSVPARGRSNSQQDYIFACATRLSELMGGVGGLPSGSAGGALSGTYPNPGLATGFINNTHISPTAAIATSKIDGLGALALLNSVDLSTGQATGNLPVSRLGSGTGASASTFWRGDGSWAAPVASAAWGAITGTLSSQTDLQTALNGKEATIAAGTTAQYWRGDKTWQTLNAAAVSGLGSLATLSSVDLSTAQASGTLAAARFPALTGDVTTTAGSLVTSIAAGAVTLADMANLAANSIIGNNTGSPATPVALTAAQVKALLAIAAGDVSGLGSLATLSSVDLSTAQASGTLAAARFPALTGAITTTAGNLATTLSAGAVALSNMASFAASSLMGNPTGAGATPSAITLNTTLSFSGSTLQRAALTGDVTATAGSNATTIANSAVTLAKMANLATQTVIGRNTAVTGVPEAVTAAQVLSWIGNTQGQILIRDGTGWTVLAPGTSGHFLRTNGAAANPSWAAPSFAPSYESSPTSLTSGGTNTFAHGLGSRPRLVKAFLRCVTANTVGSKNWAVGEEAECVYENAGAHYNFILDWDDTNIRATLGSGGLLIHSGSGVAAVATNANFNVVVRAWL